MSNTHIILPNINISGNGKSIIHLGGTIEYNSTGGRIPYHPALEKIRECLQIVPRGAISNYLRDFFIQYAIETRELPPDFAGKATALINMFDALEEE